MKKTAAKARWEKKVSRLEKQVESMKGRLSKLRRAMPVERVAEYTFRGPDGRPLTLAKAFGNKKDLLVVHHMGAFCPYCSLWADEYNGVLRHLENRAAFLVTCPEEPKTVKTICAQRGWRFRMVSAKGTSFARDMGFEPKPGEYWPGVSAFRKGKGGRVERVAHTFFGPGDEFCGVWHFFDLLHGGAGNWQPRFRYPS